jgi:uncharacterized protein YbaP (TraB family)
MYICIKIFGLVMTLLFISGCVTCDPESADLDLWLRDQHVISDSLDLDLRDLSKRVRDTKVTAPFFWEITKGGKSSWLLGTIHQGLAFSALPLKISRQFSHAERIVMEGDIKMAKADMAKVRTHAADLRIGLLPPGQSLEQTIGRDAWRILKWDLRPFSTKLFEQMTPATAQGVYITLRTLILAPPHWCMDCEIQEKAIAANKEMVYLESLDDVLTNMIGVQSKLKPVTATDFAHFLVENPLSAVKENISAEYELAIGYKTGNTSYLEKIVNSDDGTYDIIIAKRNEDWLPKLDVVLSHGNAFIAVGTGHMTGPRSLIKLLESKGYKVTRWEP